MRKYNRKKKKNIFILVLLILGISVGFALISTTLNINGIAGINKNTWDIHWNENSIVETQGSVTATTPAYVSDSKKEIVTFAVDLELPGDFYEFTVDAKNYGTITGAVDDLKISFYEADGTTPVDEEDLPESLVYSFTHSDGTTVQKGEELKPNKSIKYKFNIGIDSEATEVPVTPTPSDPENKEKYIAKIEVDYVQKKEENYKTYEVGDIVYFDPDKYELCEDDQSSITCYRWVTVSANAPEYELFLLDTYTTDSYNSKTIYGFQWKYPVITGIGYAVQHWNENLSVNQEHDLYLSETGQTIEFSSTKARVYTMEEYNNLNNRAKELIDLSCGTNPQSDTCAFLNMTERYVYAHTPTGNTQTIPFVALPNASFGNDANIDYRPVVKVDLSKDVGNTKKSTKVLNTGSIVYFDPVSNSTCNDKTYYHGKVIANNDTCYRWRVIDTDNPNSKSNINIQLDHNITPYTYWTTRSQGYEEIGPDNIWQKLQDKTSTWTRVPYLNYEYDTADVLPVALTETSCRDNSDPTGQTANRCYYGKLTCANGACGMLRYNASIYSINNIRARVITAEEVRNITNTVATNDAFSKSWTLVKRHNDGFVVSSKQNVVGSKFTSGTGNVTLYWLFENTREYDGYYGSGTKKSDFYDKDDVAGTLNSGYWTISPTSDNDNYAWAVDNDNSYRGSLTYGTAYTWQGGAYGVRPIIKIDKSLIK